jgi:hypothetical protein
MNARLSDAPVAPRTLRADLGSALEGIVLRALAKEPKDRYPNAPSMREDLEPYAWGETSPSLPVNVPRDWKARLGEHWTEFAVAVLLLALLARIALGFRFLSS